MAYLTDGHPTLLTFSEDSTVLFRVKEMTPPGIDGGGSIDVTTMSNETWRTFMPKALKTLTESSLTVQYDPAIYDDILTMLQVNQSITVTFPDESTLVFWGWVDKFAPERLVEGEMPTATITIVPSNRNDSDVETAPVYSA